MKRKLLIGTVFGMGLACCIFLEQPAADPGKVISVPPEMSIPWATGSIEPDGRLDDPLWKKARILRLVDNQTAGRPGQWTKVRAIRNDTFLYIGFNCEDREVVATLTRRDDNLWKEDAVEIFLDPVGDGRDYLEIEVNPLGTLYDAWVHFSPNIDFDKSKTFDMKDIRVAAKIARNPGTRADRNWACEIALPLAELPTPMTTAARMNLTRIDRVRGQVVYQAWSPTYRWFHVPERFGKIFFKRRIEAASSSP